VCTLTQVPSESGGENPGSSRMPQSTVDIEDSTGRKRTRTEAGATDDVATTVVGEPTDDATRGNCA
jgi:hypothetical protein